VFGLYSLSGAGRVIVMAIHQPRYAIFKLFDSLTLLSNGELVYHGPTVHALDYFSKLGKQTESIIPKIGHVVSVKSA